MFDFFKKKKAPELTIGSPVKGKTVPLSSVNDPTFSEGMLGKGAAILPSDGKIYAPADGTIETLFDTLHAFSLSIDILTGRRLCKEGGTGMKARTLLIIRFKSHGNQICHNIISGTDTG